MQVTFVTTEVVVVIEVVERSISVVEVSVSSMDPMYDRAGLISGKLSAWKTCEKVLSHLMASGHRDMTNRVISTGLFLTMKGELAWTPMSTEEEISAKAKREEATVSFMIYVLCMSLSE